MAYLVIALGVLMTAAGGYLLNYGYAIVQVERGWASVIAGSVVLTGGLVVICLGLVIRALGRLKALSGGTVPQVQTAADDRFVPAPALAAAGVAATVPLAMESQHHDDEPAPEHHTPQPDDLARDHHLIDAPIEPEPHKPEPFVSEAPEPEPLLEPDPVAHVEPEPRLEPAPPEPEVPTHAPPMDDWLDRAFSDLDQEPLPRASTTPQTLEPEPVPEPAEAELATAPQASHEPEPAPHAPEPHPETPQAQVIGRYESDGTSYVMYADGSIEAQSSAGVYRFSSMAELKAFIEG